MSGIERETDGQKAHVGATAPPHVIISKYKMMETTDGESDEFCLGI